MLDCAWSLYNRFIEQGVMERQAGSKAVYIVKISERGKFRGPLSGSELKERARSGKLLPAHFISNNDGETWSQASRVRGLEFTAAGK
jgi:hypothetical protein